LELGGAASIKEVKDFIDKKNIRAGGRM